ncbi:hypothetical protein ACFL5F_00565, partial [Planctomycetota bacterium]
STKAQITAKKKNAKKSTGPRTDEGKAVSSQNAVKHGLFAAEAVITGENPADYEAYHDQFLAELAPFGMIETMLAERIVSLSWRQQRVERMQNQAIDVMIARDEPSPLSKQMQMMLPENHIDPRGAGPELVLGRSIIKDLSNSRVLERLMLYERRIENSLQKTIHKLKKKYQLMRHIQLAEANKPKTILESLGFETATQNPTAEKNSDLKKQSQFTQPQIGINSLIQGGYGNKPIRRVKENKAKQSQSYAPGQTKNSRKREKSVAAATG